MIDTKALAERIHKAINWPGDETLSELLDDELRPLLAELANLRGELLAAKTARDLAVTVERAKAYDDGFKAGMAASTATAMPLAERGYAVRFIRAIAKDSRDDQAAGMVEAVATAMSASEDKDLPELDPIF